MELEKMKWIAEEGDARFQNDLGLFYFDRNEFTKAKDWLEKAATQGDAFAQYNLAGMYYNGEGIKQDFQKAFFLD